MMESLLGSLDSLIDQLSGTFDEHEELTGAIAMTMLHSYETRVVQEIVAILKELQVMDDPLLVEKYNSGLSPIGCRLGNALNGQPALFTPVGLIFY